jgi:hypothetical protein
MKYSEFGEKKYSKYQNQDNFGAKAEEFMQNLKITKMLQNVSEQRSTLHLNMVTLFSKN